MKLKLFSLAAIAAMVLGFASCNEKGGTYSTQYIDIVTLVTSSSEGSVFEYQRLDDSPVYMLYSDKKIEVQGGGSLDGKRMLILYSTPDDSLPRENTSIDLLGVMGVYNADITFTSQPDTLWKVTDNQIYLVGMWRTGKYLNIGTKSRNDYSSQSYALIVDQKTMTDSLPTAYFVSTSVNNIYSTMEDFYSSFNISQVWDNLDVKGLRIKVNNENNPRDSVIIIRR